MRLHDHDIAVCSWSLSTNDPAELVGRLRGVGLTHLQLALTPLLGDSESDQHSKIGLIRDAGVVITAGMIAFAGEDYSTIPAISRTGGFIPDEQWPTRRDTAIAAANLAAANDIRVVTTHVGFVPNPDAPHYATMLDRVGEVADRFADKGVRLLFETGQESAKVLRQFLTDLNRPNVGVNFDPANMILYGSGDPIEAIRSLGEFIGHVHVKDAVPADAPGEQWGKEKPFGRGAVDVKRFLAALSDVRYTGPLAIECERSDALQHISTAVETLRRLS